MVFFFAFTTDMKKLFLLFVAALLLVQVQAQQDSSRIPARYRITFTDKNNSPYSIENPQAFLSQKAIERRAKFHIAITEQDVPVNHQYIKTIEDCGAIFCNNSKWFNSAIFYVPANTQYEFITKLPFVSKVEYVAPLQKYTPDTIKLDTIISIGSVDFSMITKEAEKSEGDYTPFLNYGQSLQQNYQLGVIQSHYLNHMGQGMTIAVIDAGFLHVDSCHVFQKIINDGRLLFTRDVTGTAACLDTTVDIFAEGTHGMMVLSLIGGFAPNELIGTAPQANFILLKSEESATEYRVEEDNWVAAAEVADSAGADIISTSLGYSNFDDASQNYTYSQMNGNTARITIASDIASSKGMLLVNSAGNSGDEPWKYITAPADADSIITVGACKRNNKRVKFSSKGPTFDGRVKPDIMALGLYPTIVTPTGKVRNASGGTSFSCPLLAGCCATLWEEFPDSSAQAIKTAILKSGDRYKKPNYKYGNGTANIAKARFYFYATDLYKFLSTKYEMPDLEGFVDALWNNGKNLSVASQFLFKVDAMNGEEPQIIIVYSHDYSDVVLPNLSAIGGKLTFEITLQKSVVMNIQNK